MFLIFFEDQFTDGSYVKIREDLIVNKIYGGCLFREEQKCFLGKSIKIKWKLNWHCNRFLLRGIDFYFSSEMFESQNLLNYSKFKEDGMKTKLENLMNLR